MQWRPNLIICLCHGLRSDALSDDGTWPLATPHMHQLASAGLRLAAGSACPQAPGGMVSLLTGLHARQHGLVQHTGPPHLREALPRWLTQAGYHVAGVGCVEAVRHQLAEAVPVCEPTVLDPQSCAYWSAATARGWAGDLARQRRQRRRTGPFDPVRLNLDPSDDIDGFIAASAVRQLNRMPTQQPWALLVMFAGPGSDLPPPVGYDQRAATASLAREFMPADLKHVDDLVDLQYPRILLQRMVPETIAQIRGDYLGRVALIDDAMGKLGAALCERPDGARTWVALSADRGHLLGEHGLVGGRSFLAGAMEVPVVLTPPPRGPAPPSAYVDGLFSVVDVAPTLAALAGADVPPALTGRSLLALFDDDVLPDGLVAGNLSEFNDRLMLETERYKAIFHRCTGHCVALYDMLHDPEERVNFAREPRGLNLLDTMRLRLADALLPLRAAGEFLGG